MKADIQAMKLGPCLVFICGDYIIHTLIRGAFMFTNFRKFAIFRLSSDLYREISLVVLVVFSPIFAITGGTLISTEIV